MKYKLPLLAGVVLLGGYVLEPQWRSYDRMGERREIALRERPEEILVGVYWPFAVNQDEFGAGLHLALEEINSQGLAGGVPIRLIERDDDFDPTDAKRTAIEFAVNPKLSAVIGYYDDSNAIKASTIYESSRLLHLIIGANSTPMTAHGFDYVVRTTLSGDKISRALARVASQNGHRKFAVIWEHDPYGRDLAYHFGLALDSLDRQIVYQSSYTREHADFRRTVNELKTIDADLIFFAGLEPWAGDFLREAHRVGIKTPIVGAFSDTPGMRARAGTSIENSMFFEIYDADWPSKENREFVRKFRARFHREPDAWAAQAYDALRILARAVRATNSADSLDLSYAIRFMDPWEGANGRYHFNAQGEMDDKPIFIRQYQHGSPVTIQSSLPAEASDAAEPVAPVIPPDTPATGKPRAPAPP